MVNCDATIVCTKGEKSHHQTTFGGWEDSNLIFFLEESKGPRFLQRKWWWAQDCSWQHLVDDSKKVGSRGAHWSRTWEGIVLPPFLVCFLVDFFTDCTKGFITLFFKPPFGITSFWYTCSKHHGQSHIQVNQCSKTFVMRATSLQAPSNGVHHSDLVTWENQPLKMTGSKSLGDTGFLQFLGLFQVIMANPVQALSFLSRAGFQWRFVGFFCWSWEKKRIRLPVSWC